MKYSLIIDKEREEECIIYAKEESTLTEKIGELIAGWSLPKLFGFSERGEVVPIELSEISFFALKEGKLYASASSGELRIKLRLYELEAMLGLDFVKINQSCIANIKKIKKFDASLAGALVVVFENGERDYVSRRQMKAVKERIGL